MAGARDELTKTEKGVEEEIRLTSKERREILSQVHSVYSAAIISARIQHGQKSSESMQFEEICDAVPALMNDYKSLTLFDQIPNLIKKKDLIREQVKSYVMQASACLKWISHAHLVTVRFSAEACFGLSQFIATYKSIKTSVCVQSSTRQ